MESVTKDLGKVMMTTEGEHSLEREYEVLSVVSSNGTSYISKKNVPVNIPITNTEYWQFFGSLGVTPQLRKNIEEGYIEVSYDNGATWENLIELSAIQGPQGIQGIQGPQGNPAVAIENYITVEATLETIDITDVLPSVGSADTVYRVSNWDGIQYNETTYSEYGWYDNAYKKLATRQIGIDNEPIANSQNLVKSGGVAAQISKLGQKKLDKNIASDALYITDLNGYIIFKIDKDGIHAPNLSENGEVNSDNITIQDKNGYIVVRIDKDGIHSAKDKHAVACMVLSESYYPTTAPTRDSDGNITYVEVMFETGIEGSLSITYIDGNSSSVAVVYDNYNYTITINRDTDGNVETVNVQ